jgi:hypothetical protein
VGSHFSKFREDFGNFPIFRTVVCSTDRCTLDDRAILLYCAFLGRERLIEQAAQMHSEAFLRQGSAHDIIAESAIESDDDIGLPGTESVQQDASISADLADDDSDALFEQLLQKAERNLAEKRSIQQSQSYHLSSPSFAHFLSRSSPLKKLLIHDAIAKNKVLTNDLEQSIITTSDNQHIKPLTAPLSKSQKEKVTPPPHLPSL